jgi:hypothetical protein
VVRIDAGGIFPNSQCCESSAAAVAQLGFVRRKSAGSLMNTFKMFNRRGQEVVMVLYALRELGGIRTKQEVLSFIRSHRLYAIQPTDKAMYEGQHEWKSDTLLCWARKDAVMDTDHGVTMR